MGLWSQRPAAVAVCFCGAQERPITSKTTAGSGENEQRKGKKSGSPAKADQPRGLKSSPTRTSKQASGGNPQQGSTARTWYHAIVHAVGAVGRLEPGIAAQVVGGAADVG